MIYIAAFRRGPPQQPAFDSVCVRLGSLTASWGENVMNQRHYFGDDAALLFVSQGLTSPVVPDKVCSQNAFLCRSSTK